MGSRLNRSGRFEVNGLGSGIDLGLERAQVIGGALVVAGDDLVAGAVVAHRFAERDVHVHRQRRRGGTLRAQPRGNFLIFERFLNPERISMPDFDIDFSWDHRDAVYDYLFERYGRDHVCLLGTHVTYQGRSILRELGKAVRDHEGLLPLMVPMGDGVLIARKL